ncbi:LuxR family transcriptional regulator [Actinorhabdospora filicis]|uniref:LuxR family transcriptional regulator n=1 Tax=Actinorhabdospora filicis TaxID=1785913 RepID=A0A9W6SS67_9ACTN|nr:helix-turn-helix transcriptional regulator [Actinorhabdospora filicis]GLZ81451.1 LuxR family transcriptional regulator [Actinorhabdospora filicis]
MTTQWPFAGREAELAALAGFLAAPGGHAVITGPAGVGKSRLAAEAVGPDARVARAAEALRGVPFGAFAHLLPAPPPQAAANPVGWALSVLDGDAAVHVDDAHLLDPASTALVRHLIDGGRVPVLLTVRDGVDPGGAVWDLVGACGGNRVALAPLTPGESTALLRAALGGRVEESTAGAMCARAGGNALMLAELVRAGRESGVLTAGDGVWRLTGELPLTTRLTALIAARLPRDPRVAAVAEYVAFAEPLAPEALTLAPGALEAAEEAGVVRMDATGLRLAHPLYGEVLRETLPPLRRRRLLRELSRALREHGPRTTADRVRLAVWSLESGEEADPVELTETAMEVWNLLDAPLAARLARRAHELGGPVAARVLLGAVHLHTGDHAAAEAIAVGAEDLAEPWRSSLVNIRACAVLFGHDDPAAADAILATAAEGAPEPADFLWPLAMYRVWRGELAAGLATLPDPGVSARLVDTAALVTASAKVSSGDLAGAVADAAAAIARWEPSPEREPTGLALLHRALAEAHAGLGDVGGLDAAVASLRATMGGGPIADAHVAVLTARSLLLRGHPGRARELLAAASRSVTGPVPLAPPAPVELVLAAVHSGLPGVAADVLATAPATPHHAATTWALADARVWASASPSSARAAAVTVARGLSGTELRGLEAAAWHTALRLGAREAREPLTRLAGDNPLLRLAVAQAAALHARDPHALLAVAAALGARGLRLYAAEAAAHAVPLLGPLDAERVRIEYGWYAGPLRVLMGPSGLTEREREVARLASLGHSSREIAAALVVSVRTVDNQLRSVYRKLGLRGRGELRGLF